MSATTLPPIENARKSHGRAVRSPAATRTTSMGSLPKLPIQSSNGMLTARQQTQSGSDIAIGNMHISLEELKRPQNSFEHIQEYLADVDLRRYGKSIYESTCLDLLEQGYHRSFIDLVRFNEQEKADREAAGKDSGFYYDQLVSENEEKMQQMKTYLSAAEEAMRRGDWAQVYDSQSRLAQYFEDTQDTWLSDRLYDICLATTKHFGSDISRLREGEAHSSMGLSLEARGEYAKAAEHFEKFFELASAADPQWYTPTGDNMVKAAAVHLCRVYTVLAEEIFDADSDQSVAYLKCSIERSKKVGPQTEGMAHYRLGNVYQMLNQHDKAIEQHRAYLEKSRHTQDQEGIGNAAEALAWAHENKEDWEDAIRYYEVVMEAARRSSNVPMLTKAMGQLGILRNLLGNFGDAVRNVDQCYSILLCDGLVDKAEGNAETVRSHYGVCKGNSGLDDMNTCIVDGLLGSVSLDDALRWKDSRVVNAGDDEEKEQLNVDDEKVKGTSQESLEGSTSAVPDKSAGSGSTLNVCGSKQDVTKETDEKKGS